MKIEVDLEELLELIEKSVEVTKERAGISIPVPSDEVNKECHDAYIKGRKFGFTQGVEMAIREIRVVTGMEKGL